MTDQDSILQSTKKLLNVDSSYNVFDLDIMTAINSSFMVLNQLGVGPKRSYSISGSEETWEDFTKGILDIQAVKTYICLRAKLLFDPQTSGVLHEAVERQISEFEWRLLVQSESLEYPDDSKTESISHDELADRDLPDQHPIGAISGLDDKLSEVPRAMTQEELADVLGEGGNGIGLARSIFGSRRS